MLIPEKACWHEFLVFLADQSVDGGLAFDVAGTVLSWTEILQIGMNLAAKLCQRQGVNTSLPSPQQHA
jgi:hypothetical protein